MKKVNPLQAIAQNIENWPKNRTSIEFSPQNTPNMTRYVGDMFRGVIQLHVGYNIAEDGTQENRALCLLCAKILKNRYVF